MKNKLKIFLSSPVKGLEDERKALIAALEKRYKPEAMELWVSSPDHPKAICLEKVRSSDAVILLSGPYYGSVDPVTGKSYTELEYDEAEGYGIDVFHFYKTGKDNHFQTCEPSEDSKNKHLSFFDKIWQFRGPGFEDAPQLVDSVLKALTEYVNKKQERLRPFVEADKYFKDFLKKGLFCHDYALVGREDVLDNLRKFVESEQKVFVLYGRGGLGKSKILYEFAKSISKSCNKKWKCALFLREIFSINQNVLSDLPTENCVVILDDAHRYDDLDTLLSIFKGNPAGEKIKLIISARPLGKENINYSLSRNIPYESVTICDLPDLSDEDVSKLATSLLKTKDKRVVALVSDMTKDCPLATVVACNLISENQIDPNTLTHKEEFQRAIFDKFLQEFKGQELSDPQTQRILEYVAALSPMVPTSDDFRKKISVILNIPVSEVSRRVSALEDRELLSRKGRLVKIVPDLLSDYILYRACVDKSNKSTHFAEEVIEAFREVYLKNILFNISEVEWKARLSSKKIDLLGDAWKEIKDDFIKAPIYGRMKVIDEIEKAAVFQPNHVLEIVKMAMTEAPTVEVPKDDLISTIEWSNKSVIGKLPNVLRRIAYNIEYFERSCDILWELGKEETRELNPYPEAPLRILLDLAEYGMRKPKMYNIKMLECIKKWLKQDDAYSHRYSPLDILIKLLAKEGEDTTFKADKFIMRGFPLNFAAIDDLRKESLGILKDHFHPSKPKHIIFKSLNLLIEALSYPHMLFGRQPSEEEDKYLENEQMYILQIMKDAIPIINSQAINTTIKKDLRWYQLHGRSDKIKNTVKSLSESIEETEEFRLYRSIIGNFSEFLEHDHNFEKHNQIIQAETKEVAVNTISKYSSAQAIFNILNEYMSDILLYGLNLNSNYILSQIAKESPQIAMDISRLIIKNPNAELSKHLSSFIWPLRLNSSYRDQINEVISTAINEQQYWLCLNVAHSYSYGIDEYLNSDYENIKKLVLLNNREIIKTIIHGLTKIGQKNSRVSYELAILIDLDNNPDLADEFCSIFGDKYGASINDFTEEQIKAILDKLEKIHVFKGQHWYVDELLKNIANKYPGLIIKFFLNRLAYSRRDNVKSKDYAPLPYLDLKHDYFDPSKIKNVSQYIRPVRDLALTPSGSDTFWLPKFFKLVSSGFSNESRDVLMEWVLSGDKLKVQAVSLLLREFDQNFIFLHEDFIGSFLLEADKISSDCLKIVKSNLFGIAVSGSSTRSHGQASQKNIELRDKGKEVSEKFEPSHPGYRFYQEIHEYGIAEIKRELEMDQEIECE